MSQAGRLPAKRAIARGTRSINIDDQFAVGPTVLDQCMRFSGLRESEAANIKPRNDMSGLNEPCCFAHDFAMVGAAFAG